MKEYGEGMEFVVPMFRLVFILDRYAGLLNIHKKKKITEFVIYEAQGK